VQKKIAKLIRRWKGTSADLRKVILHYHLFKNAGTSLDASFRAYFKGDEWLTCEFPSDPQKNQQQLHNWIVQSIDAKCFSSHTAALPPPLIAGVSVFPVIFVRHPIDRVASVYAFERKQGSDTYGSVLARNSNLSEYVEARLSRLHDYQCRNFHVHRFSSMYPADQGSVVERANRAVENLPFVGVVSRFEQSLRELESALRAFGFPDIALQVTQKNVSRKIDQTMNEKLEEIRSKMSPVVYESLIEANREDLAFFDSIASRY
tara:strand:+ start:6896 stop:7681 length:786 start_codon:yes stop_codon:yes gene_type:complete